MKFSRTVGLVCLALGILVEDGVMLQTTSGFSALPPSTVQVDLASGTSIFIVGCMHSSAASASDVKHVIETVQPSAVIVELCPSRFNRCVMRFALQPVN